MPDGKPLNLDTPAHQEADKKLECQTVSPPTLRTASGRYKNQLLNCNLNAKLCTSKPGMKTIFSFFRPCIELSTTFT